MTSRLRYFERSHRYKLDGDWVPGVTTLIGDGLPKKALIYWSARTVAEWVADNADTDSSVLFRKLYDSANSSVKPNSIPEFILILADAQYRAAFVADQEINTVSAMVNIMAGVDFQ